jgi:ubiquinone/menaquinone biosynthesis C-methylase UbiE
MLNDQVKEIWDSNAEFWDGKTGEGNAFHKILIEPTQLKLLNIQAGNKILDVACGNGQFARKMAEMGAEVTAIDFSEEFIKIAKSKSRGDIEYQVMDVTDESRLKALTGRDFDSIVCAMAFMNMENIEVLIKQSPGMLKRKGIFVFSILHPCFNSGENILVHEQDDLESEIKNRYYVKISNYLIEKSRLGTGILGQPRSQFYFHRPISTILRYFFENGFVLDAFEEPSFVNTENDSLYDNIYKHNPPALICKLRLS